MNWCRNESILRDAPVQQLDGTNNTVGQFTTKLNSLIEIEGDWEVGFTEISFPSFVENVVESHCYYNIYINDQILCKLTLEPKHYLRVRDVLRDLNDQQLIATSLHDRNKPPLAGFPCRVVR